MNPSGREAGEGMVNDDGDVATGEDQAAHLHDQADATVANGSPISQNSDRFGPHNVHSSSIAQPGPEEPQSSGSKGGLAGGFNIPQSVTENGQCILPSPA